MLRATALFISVLVGSACQLISPCYAQSQTDVAAERGYNLLSTDERITLQVLLIASGFLDGVPNVQLNRRTLAALRQFQRAHGWSDTGVLEPDQFDVLAETATEMLRLWGFEKVRHPSTGHAVWLPAGLDLERTTTKYGSAWERKGVVSIEFEAVPFTDVARFHSLALKTFMKGEHTIEYEVRRDDFFAIKASHPKSGSEHYQRYQRVGSRMVGINLRWRQERREYHFERVAILMSSSLWSAATGAPFIDPPGYSGTSTAPHPSQPRVSSGTGFFVSRSGHVLTNEHVVENCTSARVTDRGGRTIQAAVAARDKINDLAMLETSIAPKAVVTFRSGGVRLGEEVAAFGFPYASVLASTGNFTRGDVSAILGVKNDTRFLQFTAPVQPGNSGGPLLDYSGNVVGAVTLRLSAEVGQNVNFAIKASFVRDFVESHGIEVVHGDVGPAMPGTELADRAQDVSVFIRCEAGP